MRYFANERGMECLLSQSFAKNFGLYNERAGTLQIVCGDADTAQRVRSQLCILIRRSYSNPPAHGARIVDRILGSPELYAQWKSELTGMSHRIQVRFAFFCCLFFCTLASYCSFVSVFSYCAFFSGSTNEYRKLTTRVPTSLLT
jgi:aspartate/tyrosine/aromatic aminotransferase